MWYQLNTHSHCLGNLGMDLLCPLILSYGLFGLTQRMSTTWKNTPPHLGANTFVTTHPLSKGLQILELTLSVSENQLTDLASWIFTARSMKAFNLTVGICNVTITPWTSLFFCRSGCVATHNAARVTAHFSGKHVQDLYPNLCRETYF